MCVLYGSSFFVYSDTCLEIGVTRPGESASMKTLHCGLDYSGRCGG